MWQNKTMVITAVIDVQIDSDSFIKYGSTTQFFRTSKGNTTSLICNNLKKSVSHGGVCLKYFELGASKAADYFILLDCNQEGRGDVTNLIAALEWCIENDVALISLSMGTTQYSDAPMMVSTVKRIIALGICFVVAASNERQLSYPACMHGCIGVGVDISKTLQLNTFTYIDNPYDGVNVIVSTDILPDDFLGSTSLATAYFAGLVSKAVKNGEVKSSNVRTWISDNASSISMNLLYNYTLNSIMVDTTKDIIVVGVEGLNSDPNIVEYCREFQSRFLSEEYHCIIVIPESNGLSESDFSSHTFVKQVQYECSYIEYIELIKKLCKPNLVIVNLEDNSNDYDVLISIDEDCGKYHNTDTFVINPKGKTPKSIFDKIVNHFDSEKYFAER
jgi:hypothetical protein